MSQSKRNTDPRQAGLTLIEILIATLLSLILLLAVYQCMEWAHRSWIRHSDKAASRTTGRAILELMASEVRVSGYSPLGVSIDAVQAGNAYRMRLLADHDGDGAVNTDGTEDENLSWVFSGPDTEGRYELKRGIDLDGDWDFTGTSETVETAAYDVLPIDIDDDGNDEPFIAYDAAPPATTRVRITFGVRSQHKNRLTKQYEVSRFDSEIVLRNRMLRSE